MSYLPLEWTKDKKVYICLRRENNHYGVVRLRRRSVDDVEVLPLCVTGDVIRDLVASVNTIAESAKTLGVKSF